HHRRVLAPAAHRVERPGGRHLPRVRGVGGGAVLEADPRHGQAPGPATRQLVWSAAMADSYDCIVIGSGPGGYVAAIRAAQLGMKTAVVEKDKVGGRCLNYACIPAKAVLRSADILQEVRDAGEFGITVGAPEVEFAAIGERRNKVVKTLTGGVAGLFKKNGIDLVEGHGSLTADGNV